MGELLFEDVLLQELLDSVREERLPQNLIDRGSPPGIDRQHLVDQVPQFGAEVSRNRPELASDDVHSQEVHIQSFERRLQSAHLVQHHAHRPDIRLETVGTALDDFRTQVVRSADHRLCYVHSVAEDSRDSEVTYFYDPCFG